MASIAGRGRQGRALLGAALRQLLASSQPAGAAAGAPRAPAALAGLAARAAVGAAARPPCAARRSYGTLVQFPLAQTGEGISECELVQWFVKVGAAGGGGPRLVSQPPSGPQPDRRASAAGGRRCGRVRQGVRGAE
jgi:hypothetical protein